MAPDETDERDDAGKPWPFPTADHHESFPASDPVSVTVTTVPTGGAPEPAQAPKPEPAQDGTKAQSGTPAGTG